MKIFDNILNASLNQKNQKFTNVEDYETFPAEIVDKIFSYLPLRDLSKQVILNRKYRVICIDRLKKNERDAFYEMVDFLLLNPSMQQYGLDYRLNKFKYKIDYSKKNINEIEGYSIELLRELMDLLVIIPNEGFFDVVPNRKPFDLLIIYRNVESGNWKEAVQGLVGLLDREKNEELIFIIKALLKPKVIVIESYEEFIQIIPDENIENEKYSFYNLMVNIFLKYILKYDVLSFASFIKQIDIDLNSFLKKLFPYIDEDLIFDSLYLKLVMLEKNQEANELESHFGSRFNGVADELVNILCVNNLLIAKKIALKNSKTSGAYCYQIADRLALKGDNKSMLEIAELLQKNGYHDYSRCLKFDILFALVP